MMNLRTGIDLVEISRLSTMKPEVRQRFLKRVFTEREIVEAEDSDGSLSGRFAAKEAVAKALGTGIGKVSWQEIEIGRSPDGEPQLQLYGNALQLAESLNLTRWSISITHTDALAAAVVVAIGQLDESE